MNSGFYPFSDDLSAGGLDQGLLLVGAIILKNGAATARGLCAAKRSEEVGLRLFFV